MTTPDDLNAGGDNLEQLRERAKQASVLEAEVAALKRNSAFQAAGLDLSLNDDGTPKNAMHSAIAAGYQGELTGVSEFVQGLGLQQQTPPPTPPQDPAVPPTPGQVPQPIGQPEPVPQGGPLDALEGLGGGTPPAVPQAQDLMEEGWREYQERLNNGARPDDAAAEVINRLVDGAVREQNGEPGFVGRGFVYDREAYHESLGGV